MSNNPVLDIRLFVRYHTQAISAFVVFVVAIVILVVGVFPTYERSRDTRVQVEKKQKELEQLNERVVILSNLDFAELERRVDILDSVLPPSKDVVTFLNSVDGLSRDLGLSLGDISLAPGLVSTPSAEEKAKIKESKLSSLDTNVKIAGSEDSIYEFLRTVENTAPLMIVKDVTMSRIGDEDSFSLSLMLSMLYADPVESESMKGVVSLFNNDEEKLFQTVSGFRRYDQIYASLPVTVGKDNIFEQGFTDLLQLNLPETQLQETPLESSPSAQL